MQLKKAGLLLFMFSLIFAGILTARAQELIQTEKKTTIETTNSQQSEEEQNAIALEENESVPNQSNNENEIVKQEQLQNKVMSNTLQTTDPSCFNYRVYPGYSEILNYYGSLDKCPNDLVVIPSQFEGVNLTKITNFGGTSFTVNSVVIPETVETIERGAFLKIGLKSVTIQGAKLKYIGRSAFSQNQLTDVTIPNSVSFIEESAFSNNKLRQIKIPTSVKEIKPSVFANNLIETITFHNNLETIEENAFYKNKISTLVFPENLKSIKNSAFADNPLKIIKINSKLVFLSEFAFSSWETGNTLKRITFPSDSSFGVILKSPGLKIADNFAIFAPLDNYFIKQSFRDYTLIDINNPFDFNISPEGNSSNWFPKTTTVNVTVKTKERSNLKQIRYIWSNQSNKPNDNAGWTTINNINAEQKNLAIPISHEGSKYLHLHVIDEYDLDKHYVYQYNADLTNPTVTFSPNGNGKWENTISKNVQVTVNDAGGSGVNPSSLQFYWSTQENDDLKNAKWEPFDNGQSLTLDKEGTWYLYIKAQDNAGNETIAKSNPFKIDHTEPKINVKMKKMKNGIEEETYNDNDWTNQDVKIEVSASDDYSELSSLYVTNSKGDRINVINQQPYVEIIQEPGIHNITIEAADKAGNIKTENLTIKISKNSLSINPILTSGGKTYKSGDWTKNDVTVQLQEESSDGLKITKKYFIAEDNKWYSFNESSATLSKEGNYHVTFQVEDEAGNIQQFQANIRIDKTAPQVTFTKNGDNQWSKTASTTVNVSDNGEIDTKEFVWTNSSQEPQTGWDEFHNIQELFTLNNKNGEWYLHIRVKDKAGNEKTYKTNAFYLDNIKPEITFEPEKTGIWTKRVKIHVTDSASKVNPNTLKYAWSQNDNAENLNWSKFENNKTIPNPESDGEWYLYIEASDNAGNQASTISEKYIFDTTAPTVKFNPNGNTMWSKTANTDITVSDNISGVDEVHYAWVQSVNDLKEDSWKEYNGEIEELRDKNGIWYLYVRLKDHAGNSATIPSKKFYLDNTLPVVNVSMKQGENGEEPYDGKWTNKSVWVNAQVTDEPSQNAKLTVKLIKPDGQEVTEEVSAYHQKFENSGIYKLYITAADEAGNNKPLDPITIQIDNISPELELNGNEEMTVSFGEPFIEPGYKVLDNLDENIQQHVEIQGTVDTSKVGTYTITYIATDHAGNTTTKQRTVKVIDDKPPVIKLNGDSTIKIGIGTAFKDPGAKAKDNVDGDISDKIVITNEVNVNKVGTYYVRYNITDTAGNKAQEVIRKVIVFDHKPPVIKLKGSNVIKIKLGSAYKEQGATAEDNLDGNISKNIKITNKVNINKIGTYKVHYTVLDKAGNKTETFRTVHVTPFINAENVTISNNYGKDDVITFKNLQKNWVYRIYSDKGLTKKIKQFTPTKSSTTIKIKQIGRQKGTLYITVTKPGLLEGFPTAVKFKTEQLPQVKYGNVTVINNIGKKDTLKIKGLIKGAHYNIYKDSKLKQSIASFTATGTKKELHVPLNDKKGKLYIVASKSGYISSRVTAVPYKAQPTVAITGKNVKVTNGQERDTITLTGLKKGSKYVIYKDAKKKKVITSFTATNNTKTITVKQLGKREGKIYITVQAPGYLTSDTTEVPFVAERTPAFPSRNVIVKNNKTRDSITLFGLEKGTTYTVYKDKQLKKELANYTASKYVTTVTFSIDQLGKSAEKLYITAKAPGLRTSKITIVKYSGEK